MGRVGILKRYVGWVWVLRVSAVGAGLLLGGCAEGFPMAQRAQFGLSGGQAGSPSESAPYGEDAGMTPDDDPEDVGSEAAESEPCAVGEVRVCTCEDTGTEGLRRCVPDISTPAGGFFSACEGCPPPAPAEDGVDAGDGEPLEESGGAEGCAEPCAVPAVCLNEECCTPVITIAACSQDQCGILDDGCGGTIDCSHVCGANAVCTGGQCVPVCVPTACPDCGLVGLQGGCCKADGTCGCPGGLLGGGSCL